MTLHLLQYTDELADKPRLQNRQRPLTKIFIVGKKLQLEKYYTRHYISIE